MFVVYNDHHVTTWSVVISYRGQQWSVEVTHKCHTSFVLCFNIRHLIETNEDKRHKFSYEYC